MKFILLFTLLVIVYFPIWSQSKNSKRSKRRCDQISSLTSRKCQDRLVSKANKFFVSYRRCLLTELKDENEDEDGKVWTQMTDAISSCLDMKFWNALNITRIKESPYKETHKFVILPTPITSSCVAVMTSIGEKPEDVAAANELINLIPQCDLYGAGPVDNPHFPGYGKFYISVISVIDGNFQSGDFWSAVTRRGTTVRSFLEEYIYQQQIDYLWLDGFWRVDDDSISDTNMTIPEVLFPHYSIFTDPINVTVCQVSITTKLFEKQDGFDILEFPRSRLKDRIMPILKHSSFLPIRSRYSSKRGELRQLYVNVSNPYCIKKFIIPAFLEA